MRTQNNDTFVGFQGQPSGLPDLLKNEEDPLQMPQLGESPTDIICTSPDLPKSRLADLFFKQKHNRIHHDYK